MILINAVKKLLKDVFPTAYCDLCCKSGVSAEAIHVSLISGWSSFPVGG